MRIFAKVSICAVLLGCCFLFIVYAVRLRSDTSYFTCEKIIIFKNSEPKTLVLDNILPNTEISYNIGKLNIVNINNFGEIVPISIGKTTINIIAKKSNIIVQNEVIVVIVKSLSSGQGEVDNFEKSDSETSDDSDNSGDSDNTESLLPENGTSPEDDGESSDNGAIENEDNDEIPEVIPDDKDESSEIDSDEDLNNNDSTDSGGEPDTDDGSENGEVLEFLFKLISIDNGITVDGNNIYIDKNVREISLKIVSNSTIFKTDISKLVKNEIIYSMNESGIIYGCLSFYLLELQNFSIAINSPQFENNIIFNFIIR